MKAATFSVIGLLMCLAILDLALFRRDTVPEARAGSLSPGAPATPPPLFGWKKSGGESFVLDAGAGRNYQVEAHEGVIRFAVRSTQPVNAGLLGQTYVELANKNDLTGALLWPPFDNAKDPHLGIVVRCYVEKSIETDQTCPLMYGDHWAMLMVRDTRKPGSAAIAALGAALGAKEPLKNAVAQNRVTIIRYAWQCLEFCGSVQP